MSPPLDLHTTGHHRTASGWLIRVDAMAGHWVISRYTPNLCLHDHVVGTDEMVHELARRWADR